MCLVVPLCDYLFACLVVCLFDCVLVVCVCVRVFYRPFDCVFVFARLSV